MRTPPRRKPGWRCTLGNGDTADRGWRDRQPVPDAKCRQHARAGSIDGGCPFIRARCSVILGVRITTRIPVDQRNIHAGMGQRCCHHHAGQTAANYDHIMHE